MQSRLVERISRSPSESMSGDFSLGQPNLSCVRDTVLHIPNGYERSGGEIQKGEDIDASSALYVRLSSGFQCESFFLYNFCIDNG